MEARIGSAAASVGPRAFYTPSVLFCFLSLLPPCQCQLGVLPLGTGNDLARVLGWGGLCDDDAQLLQILEKLERATTKMLDR